MKRVFLGSAVALLAMFFVASASAADPTGWLEICKVSDTAAPVNGPFHYTVNGTTAVTVDTGTCSAPLQVPVGSATVVEDSNPFTAVTSITAVPNGRLTSSDLGTRTATVGVPAGDISNTTTVTYTNKRVTGFVEVCKKAEPGSGLTGNFQFTITGALSFSQTVSVPVGACSNPIEVPAGSVNINETGDPATYVTSITTQPPERLLMSDLNTAAAVVAVPAGDVSTETITTYTNDAARLKICKVAGANSLLGTNFGFSANGTKLTVPAGAPPGGTCQLVPVKFRAGTQVAIAEDIVPGTQVSSITVDPSSRIVGTANLAARTVNVTLGSGETVVTYTNNPAPPGTLKLCKAVGAGAAAGSMWTFTIGGSVTVSVPAGSCMIVGDFPFNSTQTITEAAVAGSVVSSITVAPADRIVGTADLAGRTVSVMIGSGVTVVGYTNSPDPGPGPQPTPGPGPQPTPGPGPQPTPGPGPQPGPNPTPKPGPNPSKQPNHKQNQGDPKAKDRVSSARVIWRHHHHYLVIKVSSKAKHAKVRLTELKKSGATVKRMIITVTANKTQTVMIPYSSSVAHVTVTLV